MMETNAPKGSMDERAVIILDMYKSKACWPDQET